MNISLYLWMLLCIMCQHRYVCILACIYVHMYVSLYINLYVCMSTYMYVSMHVSIKLCMHNEGMHVFMNIKVTV